MLIYFYYLIKPMLPRKLQISLRQFIAKKKRIKSSNIWPIDPSTGDAPESWKGWPEQKSFALVLSHDVDTQRGHDKAFELLKLEKKMGFRSSFNFVPERYNLSKDLIGRIKNEGFEVGIHGLKHDGKLFKNRTTFIDRSIRINRYIDDWKINSFTAPSMICNLDWIHDLKINHTTCTFDTDPFEPRPFPSRTIFPFIKKDLQSAHEFVELPYTLPQDHTLFIILREKDISIWTKKLNWIIEKGGMALLNTHPDYISFENKSTQFEKYPVHLYLDFLNYIKSNYSGQYWNALPMEISDFIFSTEKTS